MIIRNLDLGGRAPTIVPHGGISMDSAAIVGAGSAAWAVSGSLVKVDVQFWIEAWQARGGQSAGSIGAVRYLAAQVEELRVNPDMNPFYVRWFTTAQSGAMYPSRSDVNDGWYMIDSLDIDRESWNFQGAYQATGTMTRVAPANSPMSVMHEGVDPISLSSPSSIWAFTPTILVPAPVNSSTPPSEGGAALARVGAEGTIPAPDGSATIPKPMPIVPSPNPSDFYLGGVTVYDTITQGGNAVPTDGTAAHTSWLQVLATSDHHVTAGDVVMSSGLLLWRFNVGGGIDFYCFNTELAPDAWQKVGVVAYRDSGLNTAVVRSLRITQNSFGQSRAVVTLNTSAGQFADLEFEMNAGQYISWVSWKPRTEDNIRGLGLELVLTTAIKIVSNAGAVVDVATEGTTNLATTTEGGWTTAIGATANQVICGVAYETAVPNSGMPLAQSTTEIGIGETTSPLRERAKRYGFWAAPFTASPSLLAEAESGTLGTGWSSQADAGSSGGNAARCLSGTAISNNDTWGTAFTPNNGDIFTPWWRGRVASAAGTTTEMTVGLWDNTSSAFVALASTTYRPSQMGTSYGWKMTSYRTVSDGATTASSTTVTSATAFFTSSDVGKSIQVPGSGLIPGGATIVSITNSTTVVISAAATASDTGRIFQIGTPYISVPNGHAVRMRAVTTATIGTNWFVDQHALVPVGSSVFGLGKLPGDVWGQGVGRRRLTLVPA